MPPFLNPLLTIDPRKLARTPGINPNEPELPIHPAIPLPKPSPMPGGPTPVSLPEMATPPMSPIPTPAAPPPILAPERKAPELSRVGVPIPALPGETGPKQYNPIEARRYDASMERAKRDESGNLTGGFKRSPKDILLNALYGFGQGAQQGGLFGGFGGAAAGAIGTAVNPAAGAGYRFDIEQLPRMQADEARTQAAIKQARDQEGARLGQEKTQAEIDRIAADITNQRAVQEANRRKEEQDAGRLIPVSPGTTMLDPRTKQPVYSAPERPQRPVPLTAGGSLVDPVTGQTIAALPAAPEKPVTLSPGASLVNPSTGETITSVPERQSSGRVPREAYLAAEDVNAAKRDAEKLWAQAKRAPEGPDRDKAVIAAQDAQAEYNAMVQGLGETYGDFYETGMGEGDWAFLKPKAQQPRQAATGGRQPAGGAKVFPASRLDEYARLNEISLDEARDRITKGGYKIQ